MATFSGPLQLSDINDFIGPSQECVKPVVVLKDENTKVKRIKFEVDGSYVEESETGTVKTLETAKVTLQDCLACSGCVTSAEAVLVQQQSIEEVLLVLENVRRNKSRYTLLVATLSPQVVSSLAHKHNLPVTTAACKLVTFLKLLGFHLVLSSTEAGSLSIGETAKEFQDRLSTNDTLPLITSTCPGWVCYAEKTHGDAIIPHMSRVRSPQQMSGSLVTTFIATNRGVDVTEVYHVAIMPCYDKKLEASRDDFSVEVLERRFRDVDCVITSLELDQLIARETSLFTLTDLTETQFDSIFPNQVGSMVQVEGGESGGFAHQTLLHMARESGILTPVVSWKNMRNVDFQEASLQLPGGRVLKFAKAYGFKNIQNVVRKIKARNCPWHFVEMMACPGGCLNGGGQIKDKNIKGSLVETLRGVYHDLAPSKPLDSNIAEELGEWARSDASAMYTSYHALVKDQSILNLKW